jgi:glycosyltransferase
MKFSIITAVYNNVNEISHAVNSVLSQTYPDIEYIIIDGASTDGTREVIQSFGSRISKLLSEPDKGIYDALNKGISLATGDVVGILHSDDIFESINSIENIAKIFQKTNCDAVYGDLLYVAKNEPSKIIRNWKSAPFRVENFSRGWMPAHPTLFVKKKVYDEFGLFDPHYKIAADYDWMLRTLGSGRLSCEYLPEVISRMKLGGASNKSLKNIWQKSYEDWQALRKNKAGGIYTLFMKNVSKLGQFV